MIELLKVMLDNFDRLAIPANSRYAWAVIKPQAKQSTRFGSGHAYTPRRKQVYIDHLAAELRNNVCGEAFSGPVMVTAIFSFPWRVSDKEGLAWALMDKQPDIDNMQKPLMDSIREIACANDGQISVVKAIKIRLDFPCVAVKVDQVTENYELKIT